MLEPEDAVAVINAYIDAFERSDVDAIVALFADDATVEDPIGTPLRRGREEIRALYVSAIATDSKLELLGAPRCVGDHAAFPFAVKLEWEGQRQVIEVIDTFRFNSMGKIVEMRAFWGPANMKYL